MCSQVLRSVSQAWANPSAVKHTPPEQQQYVSKALLLCVSLLKDSELQELRSGTVPTNCFINHPKIGVSRFSLNILSSSRCINGQVKLLKIYIVCCLPLFSELLQCMLGGMQSHLDSNVVCIRHMGMVVGECLSSRMDINEIKLKFEVQLIFNLQNTTLSCHMNLYRKRVFFCGVV